MVNEIFREIHNLVVIYFYWIFFPFVILLASFFPKFNIKKFLILLVIAIALVPVNFMISFFIGMTLGMTGEGVNNPTHYYKVVEYFGYVYWANLIIVGFLIYKKKFYKALIIPKVIELIAGIIFLFVGIAG